MSHHLEHGLSSPPQDISIPSSALWTCIVAASLLLAYSIQRLLAFLEYPLLSAPEIIWNIFVWLMPAKLVFSLRPGSFVDTQSVPDLSTVGSSTQHAAKSEVLRSILRLDGEPRKNPRKDSRLVPPGLGNWDNSCYQNSVLQALASVQHLQRFFHQLESRTSSIPSDSMIISLQHIIENLNDKGNSGRRLWTPPKLKSMSSWQQQDAQEYFSKLVDSLEKDAISAFQKDKEQQNTSDLAAISRTTTLEDGGEMVALESPVPKNKSGLDNEGTICSRLDTLQNPLEGLLAQRVGCTRCGYSEGLSLIPFNCITLPLERKWEQDIRDCLEEYTRLEAIDGVECTKCTLLSARAKLAELRKHLEANELEANERDLEPAASEERHSYGSLLNNRIDTIDQALQDEDFSEETLSKKCQIPINARVTSTKSKQAMVMRPPKCLVIHVNRSIFDEFTGAQLKNYANVHYPRILDLARWCVGNKSNTKTTGSPSVTEQWEMDPGKSMTSSWAENHQSCEYKIRAIITHQGRHENGHYVCYRQLPHFSGVESNGDDELHSRDRVQQETDNSWWRFSDEDVSQVSEEAALSQGGVFMLFYERVDPGSPIAGGQNFTATTSLLVEDAEGRLSTASKEKFDDATMATRASDMHQAIEPTAKTKALLSSIFPDTDFASGDRNRGDGLPSILPQTAWDAAFKELDQLESTTDRKSTANDQQRSFSPARMRTAGVQPQTSEGHDSFTGMRMVAPT